MTDLLTPEDLAEKFATSKKQILQWRLAFGWPCVQVGRKIRFTPDQFELIIAAHSQAPRKSDSPAVVVAGQTSRSARRAS